MGRHDVGVAHTDVKRIRNAQVGTLELHCQTLLDLDHSQVLLVFTAVPGSASYEKLQLLSVVGDFPADLADQPGLNDALDAALMPQRWEDPPERQI